MFTFRYFEDYREDSLCSTSGKVISVFFVDGYPFCGCKLSYDVSYHYRTIDDFIVYCLGVKNNQFRYLFGWFCFFVVRYGVEVDSKSYVDSLTYSYRLGVATRRATIYSQASNNPIILVYAMMDYRYNVVFCRFRPS